MEELYLVVIHENKKRDEVMDVVGFELTIIGTLRLWIG